MLKMFNEQQLAALICVQNGIAPVEEADGSPNWWMFADDARKMLATVDLTRYEITNPPAAHGTSGGKDGA